MKRVRNESGSALLDYVLVAALLAVLGLPAVKGLSSSASDVMWSSCANLVSNGTTSGNNKELCEKGSDSDSGASNGGRL